MPVRDHVPESSERDNVSPLEDNKSGDELDDMPLSPGAGPAEVEDGGRGGSWPGDNDDDDEELPFKYSRKDGKLRIKIEPPDGTIVKDPLRSPVRRRKWAAQLLDTADSESGNSSSQQQKVTEQTGGESSATKSPRHSHTPHIPTGLIDRIRQKSLVNFTNPFMRRMSRMNLSEVAQEEEWSSDSSDEPDVGEDQFYEPINVDHGPQGRHGRGADRS